MSLIESLNWRHAIKKMNGQTVPQEKVDKIIEAARLAPTSSNLQPFKIIEVTNQEIKEQLLPHSFDQKQIVDSSHILVFAAWDNYTAERIDGVFEYVNVQRGLPNKSDSEHRLLLHEMYLDLTPEVNFCHTAHQAYLAFGIAIAEAAEQKVDAIPMEGFNPEKYDEILGLKELGLRSVCILPLGYRDEEGDWQGQLKKARVSKEDFVIKVK